MTDERKRDLEAEAAAIAALMREGGFASARWQSYCADLLEAVTAERAMKRERRQQYRKKAQT